MFLRKALVSSVLQQVRARGGGFVRRAILQDDKKNPQPRWMEIGDSQACKDIDTIFKLMIRARQGEKKKAATSTGTWPQSSLFAYAAEAAAPKPLATKPTFPFQKAQQMAAAKTLTDAARQSAAAESLRQASARQAAALLPAEGDSAQKAEAVAAMMNDPTLLPGAFRLPTRLYAVEREKKKPSGDNTILPAKRAIADSRSAALAPPEAQGESRSEVRPQKRRSVDENLAIDALQLISQAASSAKQEEDEPTTNSSETIRRRVSVQVPPALRQPQTQEEAKVQETAKESRDQLRVCCLQLGPRMSDETPWDATQRALACLTSVARHERDVDLFVLPELSPIGSSTDTFTKYLPLSHDQQKLYQRIDGAFAEQAKELGVYIVYGTIAWQRRETDRSLKFTLQHKVVDRKGRIVAIYDKSYLSETEYRFFEAGPRNTVTFSIDGFVFGLVVGDDLRYPNLVRSLARDNDVDVLLHPSAVTTPSYFRQCRAVENSVYVLGVEYSSGVTVAVPPDPEHEPISLKSHHQQDEEDVDEAEEGYLLTRIQRAASEFARSNFPYYRHMKTEPKILC